MVSHTALTPSWLRPASALQPFRASCRILDQEKKLVHFLTRGHQATLAARSASRFFVLDVLGHSERLSLGGGLVGDF